MVAMEIAGVLFSLGLSSWFPARGGEGRWNSQVAG